MNNTIPLICDNMMEEGILLEIEIMPSIDFIQSKPYTKSNIPTIKTLALIDTGARISAIDEKLLKDFPVLPCVTREIKTPFNTIESNMYQLIFKIPNKKEYFPVTAVNVDLSKDNHKAIIGRDFLQYCTFIYGGANHFGYLNLQK